MFSGKLRKFLKLAVYGVFTTFKKKKKRIKKKNGVLQKKLKN